MTSWTARPPVTTNWNGKTRIGGAYLKNSLGQFILTGTGKKIIVKVLGGSLNVTKYTARPPVTTSWTARPII